MNFNKIINKINLEKSLSVVQIIVNLYLCLKTLFNYLDLSILMTLYTLNLKQL
jgi:hypothetical protein